MIGYTATTLTQRLHVEELVSSKVGDTLDDDICPNRDILIVSLRDMKTG